MKINDIPKADELQLNILILPNKIIDFKKIGILFVQKSKLTGNEYAVEKAKYLGNGLWETISKIKLKSVSKRI